MATFFSVPTWRILGTEDPGELQSIGLQRVGHHWETNTFTSHALTTNPERTPTPLTTGSCSWGFCRSPPKTNSEPLFILKLFPVITSGKSQKVQLIFFFSLRVVKLQSLRKCYRSQQFWISQLIHICCENTSNTEAYHISKKFLCGC